MATVYTSGSEARRNQVRASQQPLNGIDFLELLPPVDASDVGGTLLVYLLKPTGVPSIGPGLVAVRGGARLTSINVQWTAPASTLLAEKNVFDNDVLPADAPPGWTLAHARALRNYFQRRGQFDPDHPDDATVPARVLVVRTWSRGDLATYTLALTSPPDVLLDRQLQSVEFSFQVDESEFDCGTTPVETRPAAVEPEIDYLAKDFASFRRLMLDRMSTLLPGWTERNPSDLGVTLVEVLAAAGDYLSYYQDAVATEAYLDTARQRISVRRHARMLDFFMHDGCNARTFVVLEVGSGGPLSLFPAPDVAVQFLTLVETLPPALSQGQAQFDSAVISRAEVFEPLHDATLRAAHNAISFYTWGSTTGTLRRGATQATLRNANTAAAGGGVKLAVGELLLLEEVRNPETGDAGDVRLDRRQVVRLTSVTYTADPLYDDTTGALYLQGATNPNPLQVVEVGWSDADALAFELEVGTLPVRDHEAPLPISVARGNVVLVDHGRTVLPEELLTVDDVELEPLRLPQSPLTQQGRVRDRRGLLVPVDPEAPASHALQWELRDLQPSVLLSELPVDASGGGSLRESWYPRRDLLGSDRFASDFVVEVDDQERAWLRFGDDFKGRRPLPGTRFSARYRVGNGTRGNISSEALRHVVFLPRSGAGGVGPLVHTTAEGILRVRNPVPGVGGREPQSPSEVRLLAPTTFRTQERAVTEQDYKTIVERHPEVEQAAAVFRWTGSWHTVFIFVERVGGYPVDDAFRARLGAFLDRYRMTRHDIRIEGPRYVPLDIAFTVHVAEDYLRSTVRKSLLEVFSNTVRSDGSRGHFHPDAWNFGQPVVLGAFIEAAMAVPGVAWIDFTDNSQAAPAPSHVQRFHRWGLPSQGELARGLIDIGPLEIARLDNDAGRPENGRLEFYMEGGL